MPRDQASILTESQRQYLHDGTKLEDDEQVSNPYEYDAGIRKRLSQTLLDLDQLFRQLEQDELRKVFSMEFASAKGVKSDDESVCDWYCKDCGEYVESVNHDCPEAEIDPHWYSAAPGAFAFLAWALNVTDEPLYPPYDEHQPAFDNFTEFAELGISKYLNEKHNLFANVSVSVELSDVERVDELYPVDE